MSGAAAERGAAGAAPSGGRAAAWVLAARPKTLSAAAVPVLVGVACARAAGAVRLGPALAALAGALLIQIGTNFANDVFDAERGADGPERLGPTRVVAAGLISAAAVRRATAMTFGLAILVGFYLAAVGGWPIVAIGVASILSGIAYTGGPYPLGYHGLGDLFVLIFFGFVAVAGSAYVAGGHVPALAWAAAVPVGTLSTAILVVNNLRDRETDVRVGKRTLAVRLGRGAAQGEYLVCLALAFAAPVALVAVGWLPPLGLAPLLSAPLAAAPLRRMLRDDGAALNPALGETARLLLGFGVLFAGAIALGR